MKRIKVERTSTYKNIFEFLVDDNVTEAEILNAVHDRIENTCFESKLVKDIYEITPEEK